MRVIKNIPHNDFKITLYGWNQKYIIKIEDDLYEQTYKVAEFDITSEEDITQMMDKDFMESVKLNFANMHIALSKALAKVNDFED